MKEVGAIDLTNADYRGGVKTHQVWWLCQDASPPVPVLQSLLSANVTDLLFLGEE